MVTCKFCEKNGVLKRPKTGEALCKECFYSAFESEVHNTIIENNLFQPGDKIAIGASGGKDSTVLAHVLKELNEKHNYGVELILLSVDEGITGYRDDSLESVKRNQSSFGLPLKILSYEELYGWTMDAIVKEIGRKNNCTFCGVFRRQALDRGAVQTGCNKIVTGHNADDVAETVVMNILRGDVARLRRCTAIVTGSEGTLPRCKPFKYTYEKEIVMYAYHKKLDYFSTECVYSPQAYRGHARTLIKDAERIRPTAILDIIRSGESFSIKKDVKMPTQGTCSRCGYIASQSLCKACLLLEGLNTGIPKLGIGKPDKIRRLAAAAQREAADGQTAGDELESGGTDGSGEADASLKAARLERRMNKQRAKQNKLAQNYGMSGCDGGDDNDARTNGSCAASSCSSCACSATADADEPDICLAALDF